jgi:hypothetical protein
MEMTCSDIVLPVFLVVIDGLIMGGSKYCRCKKVSYEPGSKRTHKGFSNVESCIHFASRIEQGSHLFQEYLLFH